MASLAKQVFLVVTVNLETQGMLDSQDILDLKVNNLFQFITFNFLGLVIPCFI